MPALDLRDPAERPTAATGIGELVRLAQGGSDDALARLVTMCRPVVARSARRYVSARSDVEDVTQDVLLELCRSVTRIREPDHVLGWLRRVTAHAAFRMRQSSNRLAPRETIDDVASADSAEDSGLSALTRSSVHSSVRAALGRLSPPDRRLLELLTAREKPDYRSVSLTLDCPIGSIGPRRQRALNRLRHDPAITSLDVSDGGAGARPRRPAAISSPVRSLVSTE